eukprot:GHUV01020917.1.p1 GENE.GHUV01020917.1~~GHUV01020917.1.p1  ORF type:complete len:117 (-),score=54.85 GHUV01020917.1:1463-1813(-)
MHLDPTMEDVKKLCISCRRTAKVRTLMLFAGRQQAYASNNMHLKSSSSNSSCSEASSPSSIRAIVAGMRRTAKVNAAGQLLQDSSNVIGTSTAAAAGASTASRQQQQQLQGTLHRQ